MDSNDKFIEQTKKKLDESIVNLDSEIKDKLYAARRNAVTQHLKKKAEKGKSKFSIRWLAVPSFALTAIIILGVFIQTGLWQSDDFTSETDLEIVSTLDNIELYDDLEFYQWLAEEEIQAG